MADLNTRSASIIAKPTVIVSTKDNLLVATEWTEQPLLRPVKLTRRVNAHDQASFSFDTGSNVRQIGGTTMGPAAELDLRGKFVRLEFTDATYGNFQWTGYFSDERTRREIEVPQAFTAVGLEYFLDRRQVIESVVADGKRIGRVVPFNDASSASGFAVASRGNRSTFAQSAGVHEFASAENARAQWTVKQIIEYLLEHFHPESNIGLTSPCAWDSFLGSALDDYVVGFNPNGKTLFQILNTLINPRRSLCWWLDYSEVGGGTGTATVYCETLNQAAVTLPGGGGLPENGNQFTLNFDNDLSVSDQSIETVSRGNYKAIRTRGARITSTISLIEDYGLVPDWKSTIEDEYKDAASDTTGYGALGTDDQASRNDAFRRAERFYRVYAAYRIPSNWNGENQTYLCFPNNLVGGDGSANATYHANWLRILPHTMLARGNKYETVASIEKTSPNNTADDLMPPAAIVRVATSPSKFQYCEKLATADYAEGTAESSDIRTAYSLRVQQDSPGILLRASNGLPHMLALNHWTDAEPTTKEPELDYSTLIVTCTLEWDHYAEGLYPSSIDSGHYEEMLVTVGDQYRLDYLVPDTIVDISNGEPVLTDGGVIRDDRDQLNDIARFAFEWYSSPKRQLTVTWLQVRNWFELGSMITAVGDTDPTELNTVIGEITFDFIKLTTSIKTVSDLLDVREVT